MRRIIHRVTRRASSIVLAAALTGGTVLMGSAPASAEDTASNSMFFDVLTPSNEGTWYPSHDEEQAIIPICSGVGATLEWLYYNFSDHGSDLGLFLRMNIDRLEQILSGSTDPYQTLQYLLAPFLQVPVYAINDTLFHQPATIGDVLSFCASTRS